MIVNTAVETNLPKQRTQRRKLTRSKSIIQQILAPKEQVLNQSNPSYSQVKHYAKRMNFQDYWEITTKSSNQTVLKKTFVYRFPKHLKFPDPGSEYQLIYRLKMIRSWRMSVKPRFSLIWKNPSFNSVDISPAVTRKWNSPFPCRSVFFEYR